MITYDDVFSVSSWCENENSLLAPNHSLGGGEGVRWLLPEESPEGALPSLACPAEQGRYDIHGLES